jgi:glucokinase
MDKHVTTLTNKIAVADIGGTHARFAVAVIQDGRVASLGEPVTLNTGDFDGFEAAWAEYERIAGALPCTLAIGVAGPVLGDKAPMTNGKWVLDIPAIRSALKLEAITVLNDFAAVAHAVAQAPAGEFLHIAGPDRPLPALGTISIIGPGTGLGVAHLHRFPGGYHVQATEGGNISFAPQDELDDRILAALRTKYGHVVTERVHAGPGIVPIYAALGVGDLEERAIWRQGIDRTDELAMRAVDRFCASLGALAGDYALAHGASAVVLAGGIGQKLRGVLPQSEFGGSFRSKPRYEAMMADIPVKLITHPQPGLLGAVAAFAQEHF